jgi:hypothetical protein
MTAKASRCLATASRLIVSEPIEGPILIPDEVAALLAVELDGDAGVPSNKFWHMNLRACGFLDEDDNITEAGRAYLTNLETNT